MFPGCFTDTATCEWSVMRMRHGATFKNLHNATAPLIGGETITNCNSYKKVHSFSRETAGQCAHKFSLKYNNWKLLSNIIQRLGTHFESPVIKTFVN